MTGNGAAPVSAASGWARLAGRHPLLAWLDAALRGSGQVIFMDNPLTGLLNFVALCWGAFAGGTTLAVAIGAVVGNLVSTAAAYPLRADRAALRRGLCGFNGLLVGAGIPTFLAHTPLMWLLLVFAAAGSTVVTLAIGRWFDAWKLPGLTFPFVLTTWLVLLAAYRLPGLPIAALPPAELASQASAGGGLASTDAFIRAALRGVAQVFFVDNPVSGAIFLLALAVESRWCAALAAFGAAAATACALAMGADANVVAHGLWSYSAVLTAPAIGCVFLKPGPRSLLYGAAATLFTVIVQGATATFAGTLGIPALTFPFVLTTWLFLLAWRGLGTDAGQ